MEKKDLGWIFFTVTALLLITTTIAVENQKKDYIKISDIQNQTETICIASYPRITMLECPCTNMNEPRCQKSSILPVVTTNLASDYEGFVIQGDCKIGNVTFERSLSVYDCTLNVNNTLIDTMQLNITLTPN